LEEELICYEETLARDKSLQDAPRDAVKILVRKADRMAFEPTTSATAILR
jgi:hypothetical protein